MDVAQNLLAKRVRAASAKPKREPRPIQIKWRERQKNLLEGGSFESVPTFVKGILMTLTQAVDRHRMAYIHLPKVMPMTVNSQLQQRKQGGHFLHPDVKVFRDLVGWEVIRQSKKDWRPQGALAVVMGFYSPDAWVTDEGCIRVNDCDNRIKPTLDALQNAMPYFHDEAVWFAMGFKAASNTLCTRIWLFDTGTMVSGFNFR